MTLMFSVTSKAIQKVLSTGNVYLSRHFFKGDSLISRITGHQKDLWDLYNEVVYPPLPTVSTINNHNSDNLRPGEVTHRREDILYSQKKLWFLAHLIRGRSVDDAFAQLGFRPEKGARILEEVLEEAIESAVKEHDFEFCTKIWIESVRISRGRMVPRLYKGLRSVAYAINFHYTNLYMRLREGDPPKMYHPSQVKNVWTPSATCPPEGRNWGSTREMVHREIERLRSRRIKGEL
ncbi:unnamed protein product [Heterobilharzia americana]|nr:unnamed protein product [Heterobilharzia americana]